MRLHFGQDLELNLQDAVNVMTPNIIKVARSGSQRGLLSCLLGTEANKDGMLHAHMHLHSHKLHGSMQRSFISSEISDLEKSAAMLILPALFKESAKFLYCLDEVCVECLHCH